MCARRVCSAASFAVAGSPVCKASSTSAARRWSGRTSSRWPAAGRTRWGSECSGRSRAQGSGHRAMIGAPVTALLFDEGPLGGLRLPVDGEVTLGRVTDDVGAGDPELSRRHALLRPMAGGIEVEDLGSTNGTWVDGVRIVAPTLLAPGSE